MSTIDAVLLGLVQGLTEFLPVSSSGHLVIFQRLLGLQEPGVTLEVFLHFGTLFSVIIVFRNEFYMLFKFYRDKEQLHFLLMLIVGTIATALIGLLFKSHVELLFDNTLLVGFMLLITGTILKLLTIFPEGDKSIKEMNAGDAVIIGLIQGLAVIPGISRSGSTIMASLWRGLDRNSAIRYSFMLSAPVIFGATVLEAINVYQSTLDTNMITNYLVGGIVAFFAGIIAIKLFIKLLVNKKFHYFAYYCFAAGITVILFTLLST